MLMYNRSGKHAINLKCLLCCCCAKDIDKLNCFKSEWIEGSTNYRSSNMLAHAVSEQHQNVLISTQKIKVSISWK